MIDPNSVNAASAVDHIYNLLVAEYNIKLSSRDFKRLVTDQTTTIYQDMVKQGLGIPARVSFGVPDARAIKYLDESTLTFLGKYANSPETEVRFKRFIKSHYLERGVPIGNNPTAINKFMDEFKADLDLSKAQVRNIIDTTVSRARVFGQVNGLRVAQAKTFIIAGPDDDKTCGFCKDMVGRTFTVQSAVQRQDSMIAAGPANVNDVSPFLKGNMSLDEVEASSDAELEAAGFALPPYHGSCRHRLVVGDFFEDGEAIPYDVGE